MLQNVKNYFDALATEKFVQSFLDLNLRTVLPYIFLSLGVVGLITLLYGLTVILYIALSNLVIVLKPFIWAGDWLGKSCISLYRNRLLRRMIQRAQEDSNPVEITGELNYDSDGFFISVKTATGTMNVRIQADDAYKCCFKPKTTSIDGPESAIRGSSAVRSPLPACQISFKDGNQHIGYGVRATVGGKDVILTARHNLHQLKLASTPLMANGKYQIPFLTSWTIHLQADKLDIVGIEVPPAVFAGMQIRSAKLVRTPSTGAVIKVYGNYQGENVYYPGTVAKVKNLWILHTATTYPGFSGAPIFTQNGAVCGIHTHGRGTNGNNAGPSIDTFLLNQCEGYYGEDDAFKEMEIDEDVEREFYDLEIQIGKSFGRVRTKKNAYDPYEWVIRETTNPVSWADLMDEEDQYDELYGDDFKGTRTEESEKVKGKRKAESSFGSLPQTAGSDSEESVVFILDSKLTKAQKANNGKGLTPDQLKARALKRKNIRMKKKEKGSCSEKSEKPRSGPAQAKGKEPKSAKKSLQSSQSSASTSGPRKESTTSGTASSSTPGNTQKVTNQQSGSSTSPCQPWSTQETIPILVFQLGPLPALWKDILRAHGSVVGKKRMYITDHERHILEQSIPEVHHATLKRLAILAPNMQPKKRSLD
nr:MAG: hypothetical protein [Barnaviridae sp.]